MARAVAAGGLQPLHVAQRVVRPAKTVFPRRHWQTPGVLLRIRKGTAFGVLLLMAQGLLRAATARSQKQGHAGGQRRQKDVLFHMQSAKEKGNQDRMGPMAGRAPGSKTSLIRAKRCALRLLRLVPCNVASQTDGFPNPS